MLKLSKVINMYFVLQFRDLVSVKELSEMLEVSERVIKGYKVDLEDAGVDVETVRGRYGGYRIPKRRELKGLKLKKEELEALKLAGEFIEDKKLPFSEDFSIGVNKILNSIGDAKISEYVSKQHFKSCEFKEKEKSIWNVVNRGIINRKKVALKYSSLNRNNYDAERVVRPYGFFYYDGSCYFYGFCEVRSEVRYFKLSRIKEVKITEEPFEIKNRYDIKRKLRESFGIFDDEEFDLEVNIKYPMSQIVIENPIALSQNVDEIGNGEIKLKAKLKGYKEVLRWVLSMGNLVKVIEPEKLRVDILTEIEDVKNLYEK